MCCCYVPSLSVIRRKPTIVLVMEGPVLNFKISGASPWQESPLGRCWRIKRPTLHAHSLKQSLHNQPCRRSSSPSSHGHSLSHRVDQSRPTRAKTRRLLERWSNYLCQISCIQQDTPDAQPAESTTDSGVPNSSPLLSNENGTSTKRWTSSGVDYFNVPLKSDNGIMEPVESMEQLQLIPTAGSPDLAFIMDILMRVPAWADALTEKGMLKKRTFYSHDDWIRHRSSTRHYRHFISSLSSRVILSLIPPVGTMTAIAAVIALYNSVVLTGWLPSFIPVLHASALPYQLTAPALALLLVFRTEASYSRYDEARKTWTEVISRIKDMARQALAWIQHPTDSRQKKLLLDYIMAFPVSLKCHLLHGSNIAEELVDILEEDDLALVMSSDHRPNCLIQLMTHTLKCVQLEDHERSLLDSNISQFNNSISVCERLIRTPIPLSYTRLTSRFLVLWHLTLPVVLWDDCHWMVVPATFISAASLFCIEEVGVLIEEPFPILALGRMCARAHENVQELVKLQANVEEHLNTKTQKLKNNGATTASPTFK